MPIPVHVRGLGTDVGGFQHGGRIQHSLDRETPIAKVRVRPVPGIGTDVLPSEIRIAIRNRNATGKRVRPRTTHWGRVDERIGLAKEQSVGQEATVAKIGRRGIYPNKARVKDRRAGADDRLRIQLISQS